MGMGASGVIGKCTSVVPHTAPAAWQSIVTGKRPHRHGILGKLEPLPNGRGVRGVQSTRRKTKALWNILNQEGLATQLVGGDASPPAEALKGAVVSDHFPLALEGLEGSWPVQAGSIHPKNLVKSLAELRMHPAEVTGFDLAHFAPRLAEMERAEDPRLMELGTMLAETVSLHAAATELRQNQPWDLHAVFYPGLLRSCQGFMKYHPPRPDFVSEEDFEMFRHVVEASYVFHDQMLGALLEVAGEEATVLVVSDHVYHAEEHLHNAPWMSPALPQSCAKSACSS
ncbi:MAG: putative AlkP superfamily phosphohydrolase/phosphomutase [Kiritimatiellia bacterium]|jgi:predicted AlkP superfamily phosphohydrolase/phosphomutase